MTKEQLIKKTERVNAQFNTMIAALMQRSAKAAPADVLRVEALIDNLRAKRTNVLAALRLVDAAVYGPAEGIRFCNRGGHGDAATLAARMLQR
jgi:histidinol-phosphate/aromatic aminotransferase/cobyric acid decarboxylase-like protein